MTKHSTAHYLLEGLMDAGIDHVFANFGTDHVSIIEELANWKKAGRRQKRPFQPGNRRAAA